MTMNIIIGIEVLIVVKLGCNEVIYRKARKQELLEIEQIYENLEILKYAINNKIEVIEEDDEVK